MASDSYDPREDEANRIREMRYRLMEQMFHGPEEPRTGNLRDRIGKDLSPSDYYMLTGRIYSGGTGDKAMRDSQGRITGYQSRGVTGNTANPLASASGTPGLDAFHAMNPEKPHKPTVQYTGPIGPPQTGAALPSSIVGQPAAPATPAPTQVMPLIKRWTTLGGIQGDAMQSSLKTKYGWGSSVMPLNVTGIGNAAAKSPTLPASLFQNRLNNVT